MNEFERFQTMAAKNGTILWIFYAGSRQRIVFQDFVQNNVEDRVLVGFGV